MVEFGLLGPVQIWAAGRPLGGGQPRQRLVLAGLLADAGQLVTAEQLVDRVWGHAPPAGARRALHSHIARVRGRLALAAGPGQERAALVHHSGGYVLEVDPDRVDVHRFRRLVARAGEPGCAASERVNLLREAVGLWRGEPLAGLPGQWAARVRGGWHRQRTQAVVAWANAELRAGSPAAVIGPLTDMVGEYPLVEPLSAVLMRALSAAGRGAEALACYRVARTSLVSELGTEPGAELQEVHRAVLRGDLDRAVLRGDLDRAAPVSTVDDRAGSVLSPGAPRAGERAVAGPASPPAGELVGMSLVELAVNRLRDEILSGRAVPGERLIEEQLTRRLGVSRAPLREALRLLGEQGLVEHTPRRGARVAVLSRRDVEELYAVREVIERHVVATVLPITDPAGLSGMRDGLASMAAAVSSGDLVAAGYAHRGFHAALAALAGNRQLSAMYESVLLKLQLYLTASRRGPDGSAASADGVGRHGRLLRAVESGDRELTQHELASHGGPAA
jgi:DNA-binding GntR family transcriptional regulator/DNA-binding SARP family transcriptional activator